MTSTMGIRQRLTAVFVFFTIAPLILVGLLLSWQIYQIQKKEAVTLLKEVAKRVISEISTVSSELTDDLERMVSVTGLLEKDLDDQYKILSQVQSLTFRQKKNVFNGISLLDLKGRELIKVSRLKIIDATELGERSKEPIFHIPFKDKKNFYGVVSKDPATQEPIMEMSMPLMDKWTGKIKAVLVATIRLNHVWETVIEESVSDKISIFIASDSGVIVSHDDPSISLAEKKITVPVEGVVLKGFDGVRSIRVTEAFQLGSQWLYLVCDYHMHDAFTGLVQSLSAVAFFIVSFLVISLLVAYYFVNPIVRRIEALGKVAVSVFEGDFGQKADDAGNDEVAFLGKAMNTMTSRLVGDIERRRQAEEDLREAQKHLEAKVALRTKELSNLNKQLRAEIDEKEIAEISLLRAQEELEFRVAKRTSELAKANQSLKEEIAERNRMEEEHKAVQIRALSQNKLATLGEVATGVAHEVNQPLSYIKIIFESVIRDLKAGSVDQQDFLEECKESLKQIGRITAIIDHLRTFGRTEVIENVDEVNLADVWKNTIIIFGERIRLSNVAVKEYFEDDITVRGNSLKLEQLFINLLQNSLDAMRPKGGGELKISIQKDGDMVVVTFSDTGVGMSQEVQEKMFEPFYTTKKVGEGTGLGLSISYGIIQEHQGTIECQSLEDESTVFTVRFPSFQKAKGA